MLHRFCVLFTLSLAVASTQPVTPDTPAGRALNAWLEAFNSADQGRIDGYYRQFDPAKIAEIMLPFREATGGFDLVGIETSEPLHIAFRVKERQSETQAMGKLDMAEGQPPVVKAFLLRAVPNGAPAAPSKIDAATRAKVIDGVIANLNEYYVFSDVARQMEETLRIRQKRGEYDSVTDGDTFAEMLTKHLREISHDKHLGVQFSPVPLPEGPPDGHGAAEWRKQLERMNCGFQKVERLSRNIGYLKFNVFADPEICGPTAITAMNFLANSSAIIIDLRENGGGQPEMIALVSTYLFSQPTHLNDLWERKGDTTQQYWTLPYVPGKRLDDKPVYVLTSRRTFSGAEEFTYNLKNLKRAMIVGETTGGGAHPVSGHRIDEHFMVGVPFARAINPITKSNWEGTGVEPDVKVAAADALATAEKLAAEKLSSK